MFRDFKHRLNGGQHVQTKSNFLLETGGNRVHWESQNLPQLLGFWKKPLEISPSLRARCVFFTPAVFRAIWTATVNKMCCARFGFSVTTLF